INGSVLHGHYEQSTDRESAYEKLKARTEARQPATAAPGQPSGSFQTPASRQPAGGGGLNDILFGTTGPRGGHHDGLIESAAKSAARAVGSTAGRELLRGVLGSIFGGRR